MTSITTRTTSGTDQEKDQEIDQEISQAVDPLWSLVREGFDPIREREIESIMSFGNGYLGTRASVEELSTVSEPGTFILGVYDSFHGIENPSGVVVAPDWQSLRVSIDGAPISVDHGTLLSHRRILDMKSGRLIREWKHQDAQNRTIQIRTERFASMADYHLLGQRIMVRSENYSGPIQVQFSLNARSYPPRQDPFLKIADQSPLDSGGIVQVTKTSYSGLWIVMASQSLPCGELKPEKQIVTAQGEIYETWAWEIQPGERAAFQRLVSVFTSRDADLDTEKKPKGSAWLPVLRQTAGQKLSDAVSTGFKGILEQHVLAWENRWQQSDIVIEGDEAAQRAIRFAVFHLNCCGAPWDQRTSIGARNLSGISYEGHVFWDTEIFMLPFFIYTWPEAARSFLMYRYMTLKQSIQNAVDSGYRGAYYAWESAITGKEETPPYVRLPDGEIIPILSGFMEDHIVADVAYAIWHYWKASGDDLFFENYGARIVLECARFWGSRVTGPDPEGAYHINHVVGPDEYHEDVTDNAFTNVMAKWNLEAGIETYEWIKGHAPKVWKSWYQSSKTLYHFTEAEAQAELGTWREIASGLCLNFHPDLMLFEQHTGFFQLEPLNLSEYKDAMAPIDVVLGRRRVQMSQVLKQADVLMIFVLLGSQYGAHLWASNYYYYEPRTIHGSSLSPPIHSLLAARIGDMDRAMCYFKQTVAIDLDNNMGNAAGGLHMAALGGLWQTVLMGFAGFQVLNTETIYLAPHMPFHWNKIALHIQFQNRRIDVEIFNEPETLAGSSLIPATKVMFTIHGEPGICVQLSALPAICPESECCYGSLYHPDGTWTEWEKFPVSSPRREADA